jgi:hypothetical protein
VAESSKLIPTKDLMITTATKHGTEIPQKPGSYSADTNTENYSLNSRKMRDKRRLEVAMIEDDKAPYYYVQEL